MRLLSAGILVAGLAIALAGCPEHDLDTTLYPDAWWIPGPDAGRADAALAPTDAAVWVAVPPPSGVSTFVLDALAAKGSTMAAVGPGGTAFLYDSATPKWDSVTWSVTANLNAISMPSPSDWWIVGDSKTVVHWDGAKFDEQVLPGASTPDLKAVGVADLQVWAAGVGNARYLFDVPTTTWTDETPPPGGGAPPDVTGLWGSGGATLWGVDTAGHVYRITKAQGWQVMTTLVDTSQNAARLLALWGVSDDDFWLVGERAVWRCTGAGSGTATFKSEATGDAAAETWRAVWGRSASEVWIGSKERGLLKWNGQRWERTSGYDLTGGDLFGLGGSAQLGTWAVGANVLQQLAP